MNLTCETSSVAGKNLSDVVESATPLLIKLIKSGYERRKSIEQPPSERLKPEYQGNLECGEVGVNLG